MKLSDLDGPTRRRIREQHPEAFAELPKAKREPVELIVPTFRSSMTRPVWEIPVETRSETNLRSWRARSKRSDAAWSAVSKAMGPHLGYLAPFSVMYHYYRRPIHVRFTRIGGKRLDRGNAAAALKGVEDAVAFLLGASDGDAKWLVEYEQEPGGPLGVRFELWHTEEVMR